MDSLINYQCCIGLAHGDYFGALNRVALREDSPALALRGIAMAQLGDLERAKLLLRKAARGFGNKQLVRDQLIKIAFRQKRVDESLRARLRVEIGRLRAEISSLAEIKATAQGFLLVPRTQALVVLQQPIQEKYSAIIAIL